MRRTFALALFCAALALPAALAAAPPAKAVVAPAEPQLRVAGIEARLFYSHTGQLSDDLLQRSPPFSGWNTVIGEGASGGAADDLLVTVRIESVVKPGEEKGVFSSRPVTVTARARGKVVASRTFSGVMTSEAGVSYQGLYLRDIGCAGTLTIDAVTGGMRKTATLQFDCGE